MRFLYENSSLEGINFSLKGEQKKAVKEPYEGFEKYHLPTACRFYSLEERKENHAACVRVIC